MCRACADAIVRIMARTVLDRRIALRAASEADRPARLKDRRQPNML
jgi:hypothetical protein